MVGRPTASSRRAETCPKLAVDLLRGYRCRATLLDIAGALLELGPPLLFEVSGAGRLFSEAPFELGCDERAILGGQHEELVE